MRSIAIPQKAETCLGRVLFLLCNSLLFLYLLPAHGIAGEVEPAWSTAKSEHFVVVSDIPETNIHSVVLRLEESREVLKQILPPRFFASHN
jgi:hypothetical protein